MKGIGLVGALAVLEERGLEHQNIAGTSAGAITAALAAAGYTAAELREVLTELDFTDFKDTAWEDRLPAAGMPLSIIRDQGIYEGNFLLEWIGGLLAKKGVETFADLVHPEFASERRYRYRAQMIASDITARRLLVLPGDAVQFGVEPDRLSVAEAVRMSMSIPIFFEPWRWKSERDGRTHLIVDGGVLSNFPVWLFDSPGEPKWPTFGLMLVEPDPRKSVAERIPDEGEGVDTIDFIKSLVHTMLEAHDRMYLESATFVRTIAIDTLGVHTTEFDLSRERADELYESGRRAAEVFLSGWDFEAYKASFREGAAPGRREALITGEGTG